jgi:zinc transport system substrate-binding protein
VLARSFPEPFVHLTAFEFGNAVAARADEMMVVPLAAQSVARLARPVRELVDDAVLAEEGKRPVDGGETDWIAAPAKARVDLLRGRIVRLGRERLEDEQALARRPEAGLRQAVAQSALRMGHRRVRYRDMRLRIILILPVVSLLTACGPSVQAGPDTVVASFYPLAFAAQEIAPGDPVENLTPPGAEPHDLELSPIDAAAVRDARLVLLLGHGFQPQLEDAAGDGDNVLQLLDTAGLDLLPNGDPHVWLDPLRYANIVERIGQALGAENAASSLIARLQDLDAEYREGLANCERREIVTSHEAFAYLAERYGLEQVPITGLSPEAEPQPADLARVVQLVEERGVTTIYYETLVSPRIAETVARETGAQVAVLDPIEGLTPAEIAKGEDYFTRMRSNLRALEEGLGCS